MSRQGTEARRSAALCASGGVYAVRLACIPPVRCRLYARFPDVVGYGTIAFGTEAPKRLDADQTTSLSFRSEAVR